MPGRENLTVEEFTRSMTNRDEMHKAQFAQVLTKVEALAEQVEKGLEAVCVRMDVANGRTTKLEDAVNAVKANGCGQLSTHRATLEALTGDDSVRWHERPVVRGVAGGGAFILLLEIIKELLTKHW